MKDLTSLLTDYLPQETKNEGLGLGQTAAFNTFVPLGSTEALPEFPLEAVKALIPYTGEFIRQASEMVQAPLDLVGSCVLGTMSVACRGRYPVRLPNGHTERPCFYFAPIAPPSERKSGVISVVTRPLVDYEIKYNKEHTGKLDENFEPIEPLRLFGADVTPEKLSALLKAQGGVFALISAEGGGLFENIGRYCDKGGLEIYLNGYSGDRVCVDRKHSDSVVIDCPTLNIIAPCQPSVISDLFSDKQKSGRGLLSRMLYVKCTSKVGGRKASSRPIDKQVSDVYNSICKDMLYLSENKDLTFDEQAFAVYCNFFDEIEPLLSPEGGELAFMAEWAGKLHGTMVRLSGLIHCFSALERGSEPSEQRINAGEAEAAVTLSRFYLAHAKAVYSEQSETPATRDARYLWGKLKSVTSVTKGDLVRKTQGKHNFNLDESLVLLEKHGYIRTEHLATGGRQSETVFVNPNTQK